ncbi:MAG: hypothetical protein CVU89_14395 [Firmicutes bacterium HGW-Firmicutes-14]|jgi:hypothetical protein|nr:MAG: hypothetical protein CVU89_14395 [Firmicutes bacterium HGW-Firmicutes-14]
MCISIVFAANIPDTEAGNFKKRIEKLGNLYQYGIGMGEEMLLPGAGPEVKRVLSAPDIIFEVHDLPEPHCACDIDHDIRTGSKLGKMSRFFDFIREVLEYKGLKRLSLLFFQDEFPGADHIREEFGTFDDLADLLNRWNTWQVAGYEPTRRAYYIADESPLLFTVTGKKISQ